VPGKPPIGVVSYFDDLVRLGSETEAAPGWFLWHEGDPGDSVVLVLSGTLDVVHQTSDGDEIVLRTVEPGAILGEIACLDGQPRSAAVRCHDPCRIVAIPAPAFRELVTRRPDILADLFWQQIDRVRSLTQQVTQHHRQAILDPLTGLYNFGFFRDRLKLEVERARATADPISLALFDIDHFKHYNDTFGHQKGNQALIRIATTIKEAGRRGDIVARYGGEEFVALLYGATRDDTRAFAEGVRRNVAEADFEGGSSQPLGRVTISGGVATFPEDAVRDETLIEVADMNLYRAKDSGRNAIVADPNPLAFPRT
jgi:diguanylate cyclase (GGDEF)-like protein